MADEITRCRIKFYTCNQMSFNRSDVEIRGRSAEDHRGRHVSNSSQWRTPISGGSKIVDFSFYLHHAQKNTAEDLRGRPLRKSWIPKHTVENCIVM